MNGLVLEGGGMRGLFTMGVLDVWLENGIAFDGIIGVSAGAAFGCNFKSRQIGRVLRYNCRFAKDPRYCSLRSWWRTGDLFGGEFCYHTLPDELDPFDVATYNANPTAFYVVATDCATREPVYRDCSQITADTYEWSRASGSMPFCSRPVELDGHQYLDGGLSDSIPLKYFQSIGYQRNVAVLTRPRGYRKKPARFMALARFLLRKTPAIARALELRPAAYNAQLDYVEAEARRGTVLAVYPQGALPIGRICHDVELMRRTYALGQQSGKAALPRLREFLAGQ